MTRHEQADTCRPEQLLLYHYGELTDPERVEVERHLQRCPACRDELAELQRLLAAVPASGIELTPAEVERFSSRVMERLPSRRRSHLSRPMLGWSLAGAAVLLITFNLGRQIPNQVPPPEKSEVKIAAVTPGMPDLDLLQNLDLLENFELVQQLDKLR